MQLWPRSSIGGMAEGLAWEHQRESVAVLGGVALLCLLSYYCFRNPIARCKFLEGFSG